MLLEAIKYKDGQLEILDQLKLPFETCYMRIDTIQDGWQAIFDMKVNRISVCTVWKSDYIKKCLRLEEPQLLLFVAF